MKHSFEWNFWENFCDELKLHDIDNDITVRYDNGKYIILLFGIDGHGEHEVLANNILIFISRKYRNRIIQKVINVYTQNKGIPDKNNNM